MGQQIATDEDDQPQSYTEIHKRVRGHTDVYADGIRVTHPGYWRVTRVPVGTLPVPPSQDQDQAYASSSPQCTTSVIQDGTESAPLSCSPGYGDV